MSPSYQLYYSAWCYFCAKVGRFLEGRNHAIEFRDVADAQNQNQLVLGGGKAQVPCLHIQDENGSTWLYESDDIIAYIKTNQLAS
jgi:predicted DCC family thiol-disulfide oxidoreductase YuxK